MYESDWGVKSPVKTHQICINLRNNLWQKWGGHVHPSPPVATPLVRLSQKRPLIPHLKGYNIESLSSWLQFFDLLPFGTNKSVSVKENHCGNSHRNPKRHRRMVGWTALPILSQLGNNKQLALLGLLT